MAKITTKYYKSQYKHVAGRTNTTKGAIYWVVNIGGVSRDSFKTEREAAIAVDKYLISKGKEPVNILKKVRPK